MLSRAGNSRNINKIKEKYNYDRSTAKQVLGAAKKMPQLTTPNARKALSNAFGNKKKSNSQNPRPAAKKALVS